MTSPDASDVDAKHPKTTLHVSGAADILSGLLFGTIGTLALFIGRDYAFGTLLRMGPGFLPRVVAAILVLLGIALIVRGIVTGGWEPPGLAWRPISLISGAIIAFALTIERFGLLVAAMLVVLIGSSASQEMRWKEMPFVALGLAIFCTILFGHVLQTSIQLWPR